MRRWVTDLLCAVAGNLTGFPREPEKTGEMLTSLPFGSRAQLRVTPQDKIRRTYRKGRWREIRTEFRREAPGLARELSSFYSRQYYFQSRCIPCLSLSLCVLRARVCVCRWTVLSPPPAAALAPAPAAFLFGWLCCSQVRSK